MDYNVVTVSGTLERSIEERYGRGDGGGDYLIERRMIVVVDDGERPEYVAVAIPPDMELPFAMMEAGRGVRVVVVGKVARNPWDTRRGSVRVVPGIIDMVVGGERISVERER